MKEFFRRLFFGGPEPADPPPRDVGGLLAPFAQPAVQLVRTGVSSCSHFGGRAQLPSTTDWPTNGGRPLALVATLCLEEIHAALAIDWLPDDGYLNFFYDVEAQPWGFDPSDRDGWRVIWCANDTTGSVEQTPPASVSSDGCPPATSVAFRRISTLPTQERPQIENLALTYTEQLLLDPLRDAVYQGEPHHQVGGFPGPQQDDQMALECQLVSNGIYCGDTRGYQDPRAAELAERAGDWELLLQVDSDDALNMMWGDAGKIYYWVRRQDALGLRFDQVWCILQCG